MPFRETPYEATQVPSQTALLDHVAGEARAHVQGASLKARAVFLVRLSNSPTARGRE